MLFSATVLFMSSSAGFCTVQAIANSTVVSVVFSISHEKNAAGRLELKSSCGINGLKAFNRIFAGKSSSENVSVARGKFPSKTRFLK
ncbi:MAG: hypothetical protein IJE40_06125 [Clostridia bacterium]|nr:hypothetical protein [Clostridia bacterium]